MFATSVENIKAYELYDDAQVPICVTSYTLCWHAGGVKSLNTMKCYNVFHAFMCRRAPGPSKDMFANVIGHIRFY